MRRSDVLQAMDESKHAGHSICPYFLISIYIHLHNVQCYKVNERKKHDECKKKKKKVNLAFGCRHFTPNKHDNSIKQRVDIQSIDCHEDDWAPVSNMSGRHIYQMVTTNSHIIHFNYDKNEMKIAPSGSVTTWWFYHVHQLNSKLGQSEWKILTFIYF